MVQVDPAQRSFLTITARAAPQRAAATGSCRRSDARSNDVAVVTLMSADERAALQAAAYTYPEVGGTARPTAPPGYRHLKRVRTLSGHSFESAAEQVMSWRLQERSGLRVAASTPAAELDTVVLMRLGVGPASLRIPCRVVYTVEEADRVGFAYGTLPGHPESGEELFLLERAVNDRVRLTISAFSRPATRLARVGGPATRWMQDLMTKRYLRALSPS
jgi:uncharacterized protein (UPF0548 family)